MTLEELWELFPITLVPHNPDWASWACDEIHNLTRLLGKYAPVITHIGSTAIPGIVAKPIIDLLLEVDTRSDWNEIKAILEQNQYICMSQTDGRMSFNKGYTVDGYADKVFHLHIHNMGDNDEIMFRDYLIDHPGVAKEYEQLKLSLLPTYRNNRDGYTAAKTDFVRRIVARAKASS